MSPASRCRLVLGPLLASFLAGLVGCDTGDSDEARTTSVASGASSTADASTPIGPTTVGAATPVQLVGVYDDVVFYPACGNEVLAHRGVRWQPIVHVGFDPMVPQLNDLVDDVLETRREKWTPVEPHGMARTPGPGPGDDIGTLAVWADGVARWVSTSRDLDVWMVDDDLGALWVC